MDRYAICLAFRQLEDDYGNNGILWERPSNRRRRESIGVQLMRMQFHAPYDYVDITLDPNDEEFTEDSFEEEVRLIYCDHVLKWKLPIDDDLKQTIERIFVAEYVEQFEHPDLKEKADVSYTSSI